MLKLLNIFENDTSNSITGFTQSFFFSGCSYNCKGCFNPVQQDYNNGSEISVDEVFKRIMNSRHNNVSFVFEPTFKHNVEPFKQLMWTLFDTKKTIYVWTGASKEVFEEIFGEGIIERIDYLITDPFILEERDLMLVLRGSRNQRVWNNGKLIKNI